MKYRTLALFLMITIGSAAQKQTYDLLTFTPPDGWVSKPLENAISYSVTDEVKRVWAQILIIKSTTSKGSIAADFDSEWNGLAVKPYGVSAQPSGVDKQVFNGWDLWTGLGGFKFNNETANLLLNTFSNGERCITFILMSNTTSFGGVLDEFIGSIQIAPSKTASNASSPVHNNSLQNKTTNSQPASPVVSDNFHFSTTNFDDGWTSVVKEEWVEATKGNIKVLLHYPRKEDSEYITQQIEETKLFWNLLIAPRYTSASEFFIYSYNNSYDPAYFASAYLTDGSGRKQFVALFKKGKSGWIEVIAPDRNTFIQHFGVNQPDSYYDKWDPLVNLAGLNRFAVHEDDLKGTWSSDFSSSMQYYSAVSGLYTGYNAFSSRVTYSFGNGRSYVWKLSMANSSNGQTAVQNAESAGTFSMKGNWQVVCSKIQDSPKTYNAYFSCIKGGRILWLQDVEYGSYTAYGKVAQ